MASQKEISERAKLRGEIAVSMREYGATFREIGSYLGVSKTRASQIYFKGLRSINRKDDVGYPHSVGTYDSLSVRARSCLVAEGIEPAMLIVLVREKSFRLLKIPNFGKRCLLEVEEWAKAQEQ